MNKTIIFLSMAALVFVGAIITGCSTDDDSTSLGQPASKTVTLTTTISMDGSATTRALTEAGVKTFAVGDQIAVVYTNTSSERVKAVSNALQAGDITNSGKTAKITVTLENPVAGSVNYIYPASMANNDGTPNLSALCMQDGTLATLASTLDYAKGSGDMTESSGVFTLPGIALKNQLTICKFGNHQQHYWSYGQRRYQYLYRQPCGSSRTYLCGHAACDQRQDHFPCRQRCLEQLL